MAIQRGKMKKAPAKELVDYLIRPAIATDLERSYQTLLDINKAHVLMLAKQGIIEKDVAKQILQVTQDIAGMQAHPEFEIIPDVEDLYFNFERYLIKRTSLEIGGQQHTARSRNDMFATEIRYDTRRYFLTLCEHFNNLRRSFLKIARENTDAVMSGYTHLQPSEPITLAHYCSAILNAMARDYERMTHVWKTVNQCPLGGGSMGSTTFDIDRHYTAKLLGFDKPLENSLDCVAGRDFTLELAAAMSTAGLTFSRIAMDLTLWATPEYGYIELDDSVSGCSSIMPQKKNPIALEHVRAKSGHLEAFYVSLCTGMKNVPYMHCRDISTESVRYFWTAMTEFLQDADLLNASLREMKVHKEHMVESARRNFCTVTELANYLVRIDKISFREAHEIVADVVGYLNEKHLMADQITLEELNMFCQKLFKFTSKLTAEDLKAALDPVKNAQSKTCWGGTAEAEVSRQLDVIEAQIEKDEAERKARLAQIDQAKVDLEKAVEDFIA